MLDFTITASGQTNRCPEKSGAAHHLFQFSLRAARYGSRELSALSPDVTLAALRLRKGARFVYEYDLNIPWKSCSPAFPVRGSSRPSQHSTNRSILASPGVSHTPRGRTITPEPSNTPTVSSKFQVRFPWAAVDIGSSFRRAVA